MRESVRDVHNKIIAYFHHEANDDIRVTDEHNCLLGRVKENGTFDEHNCRVSNQREPGLLIRN